MFIVVLISPSTIPRFTKNPGYQHPTPSPCGASTQRSPILFLLLSTEISLRFSRLAPAKVVRAVSI